MMSCRSAAVGGRKLVGVKLNVAWTALPPPAWALVKVGSSMSGPISAACAVPAAAMTTASVRSRRRTGDRIRTLLGEGDHYPPGGSAASIRRA